MRGFRAICIMLAGGMLLASRPVVACSPLPPPPMLEDETPEAYATRRLREFEAAEEAGRHQRMVQEEGLLASSERIVLARVVELRSVVLELAPSRPRRSATTRHYTEIRFQVVAHVRGADEAIQFDLRHQEHTPGLCDFRGSPESLDGLQDGDLVVVFADNGELGPTTFQEAIPRGRAFSQGVQALFDQAAESK